MYLFIYIYFYLFTIFRSPLKVFVNTVSRKEEEAHLTMGMLYCHQTEKLTREYSFCLDLRNRQYSFRRVVVVKLVFVLAIY